MTRKTTKKTPAKWADAEVWPLDQIKPYPSNPRTHPPAQIALLAELLKKFGPDQPIVVDERSEILKGHGRRMAALAAGMTDFPVYVRRGLSDADKVAIRLADNQVALLSGWDNALVKQEIAKLQADDYQVDLLGFGDVQLVNFMAGGPAAPAEFGVVDERTIPTEFCCPNCRYQWSGNPLAGKVEAPASKAPKSKRK